MFVRQSKYEEMKAARDGWRSTAQSLEFQNRHLRHAVEMMRQEVDLTRMLMQRAAQIRGELERQLQECGGAGLSREDVDRLIRLCHPDKHNGSEAATKMTQKLLAMRGNCK